MIFIFSQLNLSSDSVNPVTFTMETTTSDSSRFKVIPSTGELFTQDSIKRESLSATDDVIRFVVTAQSKSGLIVVKKIFYRKLTVTNKNNYFKKTIFDNYSK